MSHLTICGATKGLSPEARAEIEAFVDHLRDHHATKNYQPDTVAAVGGVLVCHVYRDRSRLAYLTHVGAPDPMELDVLISFGGDWEKANVYHEDSPPFPPRENGLWELRMPWRPAKHRPADHLCDEIEDDGYCPCEFDDEELCCRYDGKPTWTLLVAAPSSSAVEKSSNAEAP